MHEERGRLVYQDDDGLLDLPAPKLHGRHQFDNAGVAIATLRAIAASSCRMRRIETGIVKAEWPARMQRLSHGALMALAPPGSELWLDGGHNAEGGRAVAAALADLEERVPRPLVLIVGMLSTKDCAGFLRNFAGLARRVIAVPIPNQEKSAARRGASRKRRAAPAFRRSAAARSRTRSPRRARLELDPPPRILITGSLYLAGEVLAPNGTPPV